MNEYFLNKLKNSRVFDILPEEDLTNFMQDVETMSELGVQSKEDEKLAMSILYHVSDIINEIKSDKYQLTKEDLNFLNKNLFESRSLLSTDNVFCAVAEAANEVGIPLSSIPKKECVAYPQNYNYRRHGIVYDVNKWMQSATEIVRKTNGVIAGIQKTYNQAFDEVTSKWDPNEILSFKYWLKFYTDGSHNKYPKLATMKTAQYFSPNGPYIPQATLPQPEHKAQSADPSDTKNKIESLRAKIVGRLSSAERLLSSFDGQNFAGDEQEIMLKLLQDLKRKVQTMNRKTVYSSVFEDFIYRAGNFMKEHKGSDLGKKFFYKIAQMPSVDPFAAIPDNSIQTQNESSVDDTKQAFREFKELLEDGVYDDDDDLDEQANQPITQSIPATPAAITLPAQAKDSVKNPDGSIPMLPVQANTEFDIVVLAQEVAGLQEDVPVRSADVAPPQDKPLQQRDRLPIGKEEKLVQKPKPLGKDEVISQKHSPEAKLKPDTEDSDLVVKDTDLEPEDIEPTVLEDDTDDVIESALENITIHDAIARLEVLVGIYKKREVPRQLSILDIMMNTLGFSSFFPGLGEAMAKALESSQYISTRLEDVLNKLKGSVESPDADDWISESPKISPETAAVQKRLDDTVRKEQERKELRKQKANDRLDDDVKKEESGEKPSTTIGEQSKELGQPAELKKSQPLQVR